MKEYSRPRIVISKCLGFDNCRYDGEIFHDRFISALAGHVDFVPVCPEVCIGLGTPRPPVRLITSLQGMRMIQPTTGIDLTDAMNRFSADFLDSLSSVDGFILTHRSPSCGVGDTKYYAGSEKGAALGKTSGLFAGAVAKRFPQLAIEDDARLSNLRIREHFLARVFAFARLRGIARAASMRELVRFHSAHKFLILANSEKKLRELGRIVANAGNADTKTAFHSYASAFREALRPLPRISAQINGLMHMFGFFSASLSAKEKRHFLEVLESYRAGRISLQSVTNILWSWALRFNSAYIQDQVFFKPFPESLLYVEDSGKGTLHSRTRIV